MAVVAISHDERFVSAFATTEFQAVQFMPVILLPQFLLAGIVVTGAVVYFMILRPRESQATPHARQETPEAFSAERRLRDLFDISPAGLSITRLSDSNARTPRSSRRRFTSTGTM